VSLVVDGPGFESQQRQEIFLFARNVQTSSGAHPATYSVGTGGGRENDRVMRLTNHLNLVPSLHSLTRLHGEERDMMILKWCLVK
jgi:hypothetical protein